MRRANEVEVDRGRALHCSERICAGMIGAVMQRKYNNKTLIDLFQAMIG